MISSHCFKACRPQLFQHYQYSFPPSLVIIPVLSNYYRHVKQLFPPLSAVIPAISSSFAAMISIVSPINSSLPTLVTSLSAIDSRHSRYQQQSFPRRRESTLFDVADVPGISLACYSFITIIQYNGSERLLVLSIHLQ